MKKNELIITVSGKAKAGKSFVSNFLMQNLLKQGFECYIESSNNVDIANLYNVLDALSKTTQIVFKEKHLTKNINYKRCYTRHSKTWYAKEGEIIDVSFGLYSKDYGTIGQMGVKWVNLNGKSCPRLECFNDAWGVLSSFSDLIEKLGQVNDMYIQEPEFIGILNSLGFEDITVYQKPIIIK